VSVDGTRPISIAGKIIGANGISGGGNVEDESAATSGAATIK
jgi:uncharacterized protein GlcG (DUF336 family)